MKRKNRKKKDEQQNDYEIMKKKNESNKNPSMDANNKSLEKKDDEQQQIDYKIMKTEDESNENANMDTKETLESKLICKIKKCLMSHDVPLSVVEIFDENFFNVDMNNTNSINGNVICIVCFAESKERDKIKPKYVYCNSKSNSKNWIISNFTKHLEKVHGLSKNRSILSESIDQHIEDSRKKSETASEIISNISNSSLEIVSGEIENKTIKNEKYLYDLISNHVVKIYKTVLLYDEYTDRMLCKYDDVKNFSLDVVKILKDGNCLFSAVAHQLFRQEVNSDAHQKSAIKLRMDVVKFIKNNYERFKYELQGHIYELKDRKDGGKYYGIHEMDIDSACVHFINNWLNLPECWGGPESIKAIVHLFDVNIIIFYEHESCYLIDNAEKENDRVIVIAYRLADSSKNDNFRNHYDSVCNISSNDIYATTKIISKKLSSTS